MGEIKQQTKERTQQKVSSRLFRHIHKNQLHLLYFSISLISPRSPATMPRITPAAILRSAAATRQPLTSRAAIRPILSPAVPSLLATTKRYQSTSQQPNEHPKAENKEPDPKSTEPKPEGGKEGKKGLKVSWIFSGLAGLGALVTIYGLYVPVCLQYEDNAYIKASALLG